MNKKTAIWLFILFMLALGIRLAWASVAPALDPALRLNPLHGDAAGYHLLAKNLLDQRIFAWSDNALTSYRMPGYPVFLAAIYAVGQENLDVVRIFQAMLGALTLLPVFAVGRSLAGEKVGLLSAAGVALHPLLIYMTGWVYSETLFILVLWLAIWLMIRAIEQSSLGLGIGAGLLLGISTLIRPEILPFALLVAGLGWWMHWPKSSIWPTLAAQLAVLIVLIPWTVRNTMVQGEFVLLTSSGGSNFYAGNNPDSRGGSAWAFPIEGMTEMESDRELLQRSREWIQENPTQALAALPMKLYKFFSPVSFETTGSPFGRWEWVINLLYLGFLILAGVGGWKSWKKPAGAVLLVLIGWYVLTALIFYGGSRVALPVAPALIIFSVLGIAPLLTRWPGRPNILRDLITE